MLQIIVFNFNRTRLCMAMLFYMCRCARDHYSICLARVCTNISTLETAMSEEVSCPKERLEELCRQSVACRDYLEKYEECARRVQSRPGTTETCTEELFDLTPCIDKCVRHPFLILSSSSSSSCRLLPDYSNISNK